MIEEVYRPAFFECDGLGHINNTRLPEWFERAREPVFDLFSTPGELQNWRLIVARLEVDFLAPIQYGVSVTLKTEISSIGRSSFEVHQTVAQHQVSVARGRTVLVHYSFEKRQSVPIPEDIRRSLSDL